VWKDGGRGVVSLLLVREWVWAMRIGEGMLWTEAGCFVSDEEVEMEGGRRR